MTAEPAVLLVLAALGLLGVGLILLAEWQDARRARREFEARLALLARRRDPSDEAGA